jgi:hypothetical protein
MAPVDSAGQGPVYRSIDATGYWLNEATREAVPPLPSSIQMVFGTLYPVERRGHRGGFKWQRNDDWD